MKVGDRVFKKNYEKEEIVKGTIELSSKTIGEEIFFIVAWDNGEKTKTLESDIELLIEDTPDSEVVTISRSEFHDLTMKVINANNFPSADDFALEVLQIAGLDICRRLEREIFGAKADND